MDKYKLDIIDRRILSELSYDCRQGVSELATKLRLSRDRVKYRIKKLKNDGIITRYTIKTNPYRFGYSIYKTYFRLDTNKEKITKLLQFLDKHPRTYWVAECYGHWDLIHAIYAESPYVYQQIQEELLTRFNDLILSYDMYIGVIGWYFSRGYLAGHSVDIMSHGGPPENNEISKLDFQILRILSDDASISDAMIASKLNCAPATAHYRINRLEELGVISVYRIELNVPKLGYLFFKAQIYVSEYNVHKEEELREYCMHNKHILYFLKQIGRCKIEIELEVDNFDQYNELVDDMRQKFHGFVRNIETIVLRKHRYRNVPYNLSLIS